MTYSRTAWMFALLLLALAAGCRGRPAGGPTAARGTGPSAEDGEVEIPLSELPDEVRAAARRAVPGIVLEEAERETEHGRVLYSVEGSANGIEYEIEITSRGVVLEVERDDGEGAEAEDHEDDDEEEDGSAGR